VRVNDGLFAREPGHIEEIKRRAEAIRRSMDSGT
jgi:hypothetical protein